MLFPNITAMFKWANNFFPGAPSASQDYLQVTRQSDGTILGWIDEGGVRRGSLALVGFGFGTITSFGEIVNFTNTIGSVDNIPNGDFFQLYKNGVLLNPLSSSFPNIYLNSAGSTSWQLIILITGMSADLQIVPVSYNPSYPTGLAMQSPNGSYWTLSVVDEELETTSGSLSPVVPIVLIDVNNQPWELTIDNTGTFLDITEDGPPISPISVDYNLAGQMINLSIPATSLDTFVTYYTY